MRFPATLAALVLAVLAETVLVAAAVIGGIVLAALFAATWHQLVALVKAQEETNKRVTELERAIGSGSGE